MPDVHFTGEDRLHSIISIIMTDTDSLMLACRHIKNVMGQEFCPRYPTCTSCITAYVEGCVNQMHREGA